MSRFLPQLELKHKPGCQNTVADALLRASVKNFHVHIVSASEEENEVLIRVQAEQWKDGPDN